MIQLDLLKSTELAEPQHGFKLRDYQQKLKSEIYNHIRQGVRRVLVYAPTGSGKTAIISSILSDATSKGKRSMLVVHRDFLVEQSIASIVRAGVDSDQIGVIKAGYKEDRSCLIQIAGLQSLQNRATPDGLDLVILDECHSTAFYACYERVKQDALNAVHLGFSASPWRLRPDKEYFGLHFDAIAKGPSIQELITQGYLTQPRYFGYGGIVDFTKLDTKGGDFEESKMQREYLNAAVPQKVTEKILEFCSDRTGIIFNVGVEQSKLQTQLLNEAGIRAVHLDSSTPFSERKQYFKDLESGVIQCISSIGCLTEGFDVPSISYVVLARATKSRALYVQCCGRGLRPSSNKVDCLILDFGNNVARLGELTKNFSITLKPIVNLKECPECRAMISSYAQICPECGYVFHSPEGSLEFERNQQKIVDQFNREFGELFFDSEVLKLVQYARSQRRTRFSKSQPPDRLWETFRDKYGYATFIHNDWLFGAVFGGEDTEYNRQRFLEYLDQFKPQIGSKADFFAAPVTENHQKAWIKNHLELEFGKPGRNYRTGKRQAVNANIGLNSKLEWYEILQCNPNATLPEIKLNYRELARLYHPDTTALDEKTATSQMQLLNLAWEKAKQLKG